MDGEIHAGICVSEITVLAFCESGLVTTTVYVPVLRPEATVAVIDVPDTEFTVVVIILPADDIKTTTGIPKKFDPPMFTTTVPVLLHTDALVIEGGG